MSEFGVLEQGLGRDAANVEADPAPILLLDHGHLETELAGTDGGDVATGARTEDDEIEVSHNVETIVSDMRFLIAGSSGFLGSHLTEHLRSHGHEVRRLSRSSGSADSSRWDPYQGYVDPEEIEQADVVVNLAGSPTAGNPHSKQWAHDLEHSRVTTTAVLARGIAESNRKPAFLAGNGISFYGDRGDLALPESADSRGNALLTRVTRVWQQATEPAQTAGARVVILRTSPVLDRRSAPLKQQLLQFKAGLGGRLGSGQQYFPCIGLTDWIQAVTFCAENDLEGPVNLCLPDVPTNAEYTQALAALVHRPAWFHVPAFVLARAAGAMAPELLGSVRARPEALLNATFEFAHPSIESTLRAATS